MAGIHVQKENATLRTLLARIQGSPVAKKRDSEPMYREPVPEPNRSRLLAFYRNLVAEELTPGWTGVLLGNMYRISIWVNHRPFEDLTKDDIVDLIEKIRHVQVKRSVKGGVKPWRGAEQKRSAYA